MSLALVLVTLLAGGVAAVVRYLVSVGLARESTSEGFPWAVLIVNAAGSAIGGVALGLAHRFGMSAELQLIILTGVCGGLTTFSTFSVETIQLLTHRRWWHAALSVGSNLVVGLIVCFAGYLLAAG